MLKCLLCWQSSQNAFELESLKAVELRVKHILYKHFRFCFDVSHSLGLSSILFFAIYNFVFQNISSIDENICVSCWNNVNDFHSFYEAIQYVHASIEQHVRLESLNINSDDDEIDGKTGIPVKQIE